MKYFANLRTLYHTHIMNKKQEARFWVHIAFSLTFIIARIIIYAISYHPISFPFLQIHENIDSTYLILGVLFVLLAGGARFSENSTAWNRLSAILYGSGAALLLNECAFWLRIDPSAYIGIEGYVILDSLILFTSLSLFVIWYSEFLRELTLLILSPIFQRLKNIHQTLTRVFASKSKEIVIVHFAHNKQKTAKLFFSYVGLGILAFCAMVAFVPWPQIPVQPKQKVLAKAIINAETIDNLINIASLSASLSPSIAATPTATLTPSPTPPPTPGIASQSADFCLNVPVLMYHHVQPWAQAQERGQTSLSVDTTVFDQQMQYLVTHGYKTISAEELVLALHNHVYLPANDVVLTFDDGYEDNYTDAFPIAKKYGLILNLMVSTGLLGTHPATNYYYSWQELKEMVDSGLVNAYDHTWSHYPLGSGEVEKNQFEIMTAKQQLEQNLKITVDVLTYPYGAGYDVSWVTDLLKKDGFIGAFSTIGGTVQCESFVMGLHRNHVSDLYFPGNGIN